MVQMVQIPQIPQISQISQISWTTPDNTAPFAFSFIIEARM
jgi:hypothetical protein